MATKFCIIVFCIVFILIPNLVKPSFALYAETYFKLRFCSFVPLLNNAAKVENNTFWSNSEIMYNFGKRILKPINSLLNSLPFDLCFSQKVSNENNNQTSENGKCRNIPTQNEIDRKLVVHVQCPEIVSVVNSILVGIILAGGIFFLIVLIAKLLELVL